MKIPLNRDESIISKKSANLFRGFFAVGGFLYVTNQRLVFEPHALNFRGHPFELEISGVTQVKTRNTLGVIPNGVSITQKNGTEYKFVVWGRAELISQLKRLSNIT